MQTVLQILGAKALGEAIDCNIDLKNHKPNFSKSIFSLEIFGDELTSEVELFPEISPDVVTADPKEVKSHLTAKMGKTFSKRKLDVANLPLHNPPTRDTLRSCILEVKKTSQLNLEPVASNLTAELSSSESSPSILKKSEIQLSDSESEYSSQKIDAVGISWSRTDKLSTEKRKFEIAQIPSVTNVRSIEHSVAETGSPKESYFPPFKAISSFQSSTKRYNYPDLPAKAAPALSKSSHPPIPPTIEFAPGPSEKQGGLSGSNNRVNESIQVPIRQAVGTRSSRLMDLSPLEIVPKAGGVSQRSLSPDVADATKPFEIASIRGPVSNRTPVVDGGNSQQSTLRKVTKLDHEIETRHVKKFDAAPSQTGNSERDDTVRVQSSRQVQATSVPSAPVLGCYEKPIVAEATNGKGDILHFATEDRPAASLDKPQAKSELIVRPSIQQLTQAVRHIGEGSVEVRLSPEELGRVRLALTPGEANVVVSISVERPETLDLIRRNIELFAQSLQEEGFTDVAFSFEQNSRDPDAESSEELTKISNNDEPKTEKIMPSLQVRAEIALGDHLDIRL